MSVAEKMLPPSDLHSIFDYDPANGTLRWKRRDLSGPRKCWNTKFAGKLVGNRMAKGYLNCSLFGRTYLVHRIIWALETGAWPPDQIDHVNGNRSDNRFKNLRSVDALGNRKNVGIGTTNTSGHVGVSFRADKGKWRAYIGVNNQSKQLGYFCSKEEAISARKEAERAFGFHENHGGRLCH